MRFPYIGLKHSATGAAIKNAYGATTPSSAFQIGASTKARFYVAIVTATGSLITTVTTKLQHRYVDSDAGVTGEWIDLPSTLDDAGATLEVDHAFGTLVAASVYGRSFKLVDAGGIPEIRIDLKANVVGASTDSVGIYVIPW